MSAISAVYVVKLKKDGQNYGIKVGISKNVKERLKKKNTKSFGFAEPYGVAKKFHTNKDLALKIETYIKTNFRRFRLKNNSNAQEIFESQVEKNILWAVRQCLAYPERVKEISWRAANSSLCISTAPQVEIFNSGMILDFCQDTSICNHINSILRDRFIIAEIFSPRLESGCAVNITVSETPDYVYLSYIFEFLIDDYNESGNPSFWNIYSLETNCCLTFCPSDPIDIEILNSQPIRVLGSDERAVRFTETYDKKDRCWSEKVSGVSGEALDPDVERSFLQATLFPT